MGTTHVESVGFTKSVAGGVTPSNPSDQALPVIIIGSGVPTVVAPRGSLYLRTDGLPQVATDSVGTWAAIGSAAPQNLGTGDSPTFVGLTLSGAIATPTNITLSGAISGGTTLSQTSFIDLGEIADPAAPAATHGRLYMKAVGGKVALIARFPTGAVQQIAIEP